MAARRVSYVRDCVFEDEADAVLDDCEGTLGCIGAFSRILTALESMYMNSAE